MHVVNSNAFMTPLLSHDAVAAKHCHAFQYQHPLSTRPAKTVRFSTVTTLTFHVGLSCCVVPRDQAPGVGLTGSPVTRSMTLVPDESQAPKRVLKYTAQDRILLLKRQGLTPQDVLALCLQQNEIQVSRRICGLEVVHPPHSRFANYLAKRSVEASAEDHSSHQRSAKRPCYGASATG